MNAYNLLQPHQKKRLKKLQSTPLGNAKAEWFLKACFSGEVKEESKTKKNKKDPLDLALFLIRKNGHTTVAQVMEQSGYSHKKVSDALIQGMETHGLNRFKAEKGQHLYYIDSIHVDTRSTEQKILDLIEEKPRTRAELCIAVSRTRCPVIKILHKLIKEQKINRNQTGRTEYLYTIREAN